MIYHDISGSLNFLTIGDSALDLVYFRLDSTATPLSTAFSLYTVVLAGASELPVAGLLPSSFSFGLVAEALKDCSKSAMMSSMCSVPTEIRMRSCEQC